MARRFPQLQPGVAVIIWIMAAIIILNHPDFLSRRLAVNDLNERLVITSTPNSRARSYSRQIDRILIALAEAWPCRWWCPRNPSFFALRHDSLFGRSQAGPGPLGGCPPSSKQPSALLRRRQGQYNRQRSGWSGSWAEFCAEKVKIKCRPAASRRPGRLRIARNPSS
jgi:hypothetical protein